jgi:RNA-directed DNA polymerase
MIMNTEKSKSRKSMSEKWHAINWKEVYLFVETKQNDIAIAMMGNDLKKVYQIQRSLIESFEARALSVRKVVTNSGGKTSGVDNVVLNSPQQYYEMIVEAREIIRNPKQYIAKPLRRVLIPKANGDKRPLGIPTIRDRIIQAIYHLAVDPAVEAKSDRFSFGFRKKRSTHDAIAHFRNYMDKKVSPRLVLEADITKCFDRIDHGFLMEHTPICDKSVLYQWLTSGVIEQGKFRQTEGGTPQGGIISPTLCNVALNGLEDTIKSTFKDPSKRTSAKIQVIRYADDVVITGKNEEILEKCREKMEEFIGKRGLQLNQTKTRISRIEEGIDLLGFNISRQLWKSGMNRRNQQPDTLIIKPTEKSVKSIKEKITKAFKELDTMDTIIMKLNPILRGWIEHKRISWHSAKIFLQLNVFIWNMIRTKFVKSRYGRSSQRMNYKEIKGDRGWTGKSGKVLLDPIKINTIRCRPMKVDLNPYLTENKEYFDKKKELRILSAIRTKLFRKYDNKCAVCQQTLLGSEKVEIHHIKPKTEGGSNTINNLMPLHRICHIKVTHDKKKKNNWNVKE